MVDAPLERQTGAEDVAWDLSVYYDGLDDPRIETDLSAGDEMVGTFVEQYRGKVAELSAGAMKTAIEEMEAIYEHFGRLGHFASLNFTVYSNDPTWGALAQRVTEQSAKIQQQLVFFTVEWNQVEDAAAQAILDDPTLGEYRYYLEAERRYQPYQLSEAEEKLVISKGVTGRSAWMRFFSQLNAAMKLDLDGEKLPLPQVLSKLHSGDRDLRQRAAASLTTALEDKQMELTFIFNTLAADKAADDQLRGYPEWITSRNMSNKASDATVQALIDTVTGNYDLVARHYEIKRRLLGYDELYEYDRYAPLNLTEEETFYTWDEARQIVVGAYGNFTPQMGAMADEFFAKNWIHAPVMAGKRGGAYASYGTKSTHPWVFMNYTGTPNDVMTLAHELGHGTHMYLANDAQPPVYMHTPLTTAETASVFGEMIVFYDLMAREENKTAQLAMLAEKIDGMFSTVFRQVAMNRFEEAMHTARRTEGELTTERLNEIWMDTQKPMFGDSVTLSEGYAQWWSYVPHFLHTPGYVYAYAFGELLVLALYNLYQQTGDEFIPKYIELLAAGDSDYPENLLAKLGVDLNDPTFWQEGIALMAQLIDQEEALAKELFPDKF